MPILSFATFTVDTLRRSLTAGRQPVRLQGKAFDLLLTLITERHRPVSKDELYATVWGGSAVEESNLRVQMSNLRRALAAHGGADLIVTVPGRGYQFVGAVTAIGIPSPALPPTASPAINTAVEPAPATPASRPRRRLIVAAAALALPLAALALPLAALTRSGLAPAPPLPARVRIEPVPDDISMAAGGYHNVDYVITVLDPVDLQLDIEDAQFYLVSGQPVGPSMVGSRILGGSFTIRGGSVGTYHNNLYLIPEVAEAARRAGQSAVQLRHVFHLADSLGRELRVPAVVLINIEGVSTGRDEASADQAATSTH
jgi:DNA-binding winged helix-turn-helix (wHTH) protein